MVDREYWYDTINCTAVPMQMVAAEALTEMDYMSKLNVASRAAKYRLTGIMGTIGPACGTEEKILEMIEAGLTVTRINMAYTTSDQFLEYIMKIRNAAAKHEETIKRFSPIAITVDLRGPEIRIGKIDPEVGESIELVAGNKVKLTTERAAAERCNTHVIYVDYENITKFVQPDHQIYFQRGAICLQCINVTSTLVNCNVKQGGVLQGKSKVYLPGIKLDLPNLSEQDKTDALLAVDAGVDVITLSFVRQPSAATDLRKVIASRKGGKNILVFAKIECQQALHNLDEIIKIFDGVIVARGRLAIEIPKEKIFLAQKRIIARCNLYSKPVVCGKQMLESMLTKPRPTRSESADVANAVLDGADCIMLCEETAISPNATVCITTLSVICQEAESCTWRKRVFDDLMNKDIPPITTSQGIAMSAVQCVTKCNCAAIIVATLSGSTAQLLSKYRPRCPIFVVTKFDYVARQCLMYKGLFPLLHTDQKKSDWTKVMDMKVRYGIQQGIIMGYLSESDSVVLITGWKQGTGYTNTFRISRVGDCLG